jgi:methylmalonyl-CoA mutase
MQDFWSDNEPFPKPGEDDWRELVAQTVDRAQFDRKLVYTDLDGIRRQPIYPQAPVALAPGQYPYTRGSRRNSDNRHGWQIAQSYDETDPARLNRQLLAELEGGVSSIELHLTASEQSQGLHCRDLSTLDNALSGVQLELIHVALTPDASNTWQTAALLALCQQRGHAASELALSLNIDPLGQLAQRGHIETVGSWRDAIGATAQFINQHYASATTLIADGGPYHNSGASAAQQIACCIATGIEYLRVLTDAGLDITAAAAQIEFSLSLDSELFESVAIHRAMRQLWANVLHHSGIKTDDADMCLRARSGLRALTQRDSAVNMLRITTQCLAAGLGGAQSFNSAASDQLTGISDNGRRIARNTQLILMEESGIHHVQDPMGGSGHIEALTDAMAEKAWAMVQSIESDGGMFAALSSQTVQQTIAATRQAREQSIAVGKTPITGVSEFPQLVEPMDLSTAGDTSNTDSPSFAAEDLKAMIDSFCQGNAPVAQQQTTITQIDPLPRFRDAAVFETMRDRSDSHHTASGAAPRAALITLGEQSEYGPRVNFSRNFLAVAGIDAQHFTLDEWQVLSDKPPLAILCGSDAAYGQEGQQACEKIAASGETQLWLAGKASALNAEQTPDNIECEIHLGCDRVTLLNRALDTLEVAAA